MNIFADIHCHCLPGIDDGSENKEMSIEMLKTAYNDGIREIVCTPHFHPRRGHADKETILRKVTEMQEAVKNSCPELKLYPGNELYYDSALSERISDGKVCRMADSSYVLVEFPFSCEASDVRKALSDLQITGVMPILAHIERYSSFIKKPEIAEELVDMGVYLQVNADGVLGNYGGVEKRFIKKLFKKGCISFVATDAHDDTGRRPVLSECAKYVAKKFGEEVAENCFYNNPMAVINNKII